MRKKTAELEELAGSHRFGVGLHLTKELALGPPLGHLILLCSLGQWCCSVCRLSREHGASAAAANPKLPTLCGRYGGGKGMSTRPWCCSLAVNKMVVPRVLPKARWYTASWSSSRSCPRHVAQPHNYADSEQTTRETRWRSMVHFLN